MPPTPAPQREPDPAATVLVDAPPQLSARTVAWLAQHPLARALVGSVWDALTELERAGHHPSPLAALRFVLGQAVFIQRDMTWQMRPGQ
jgi:hypothetical protein